MICRTGASNPGQTNVAESPPRPQSTFVWFSRAQPIAQTRLGHEILGPLGIWLQLLAKIADTDAKDPGVSDLRGPPHFAGQPILVHDRTRAARKIFEHAKLERCEMDAGSHSR